MTNEATSAPRRRPVDVLFGEEVELKPKPTEPEANVKQATPGYMVEPPRPVTNLRPPPPEFPTDWRATAPPEPAVVVETPAAPQVIAPPPLPVMTEPPQTEKIVEATTFTISERPAEEPRVELPVFVAQTQPTPPPAPVVAAPPSPVSPYGQTELVELSQFVDQLYQNVADETSDSAALNAECLGNLNAARVFIEQGEYSKAEASAELVKARLLRARASRAAAASQTTKLLFAGLLGAALLGVVLFVVPYFVRFVPIIEPLISGIGIGMLGGAAMALWQLTQHISKRTLDASFNSKYALSPVFGAILGGILYLLSLLGILAAPNALGVTIEPFLLMYLFAFLAGMFNDAIIGSVRGLVTAQRISKKT